MLSPASSSANCRCLVDGLVHTGRVRAATPLKCLAINRLDFDRLLQDEPQIAINMLRGLACRLAETDRMIAGLSALF